MEIKRSIYIISYLLLYQQTSLPAPQPARSSHSPIHTDGSISDQGRLERKHELNELTLFPAVNQLTRLRRLGNNGVDIPTVQETIPLPRK